VDRLPFQANSHPKEIDTVIKTNATRILAAKIITSKILAGNTRNAKDLWLKTYD
jgi:hypothetical protein